MTFCGMRGQFGDGAITYKLANQRPLFYVQNTPPNMTRDQFVAACLEAFGRWSAVCDVVFAPTNDQNAAQFVIFTHQFDGPSGILADCEFPSPGLRPQSMRIDPSERWQISDNPAQGYLDLLAVLCHEMGHGIGLQHFPTGSPAELMEPVYNPAIVRPQSTEAAYAAKLYGLPQTQTPPTPPNSPPLGDSLGIDLIITQANGSKYSAKGTAKRVA